MGYGRGVWGWGGLDGIRYSRGSYYCGGDHGIGNCVEDGEFECEEEAGDGDDDGIDGDGEADDTACPGVTCNVGDSMQFFRSRVLPEEQDRIVKLLKGPLSIRAIAKIVERSSTAVQNVNRKRAVRESRQDVERRRA